MYIYYKLPKYCKEICNSITLFNSHNDVNLSLNFTTPLIIRKKHISYSFIYDVINVLYNQKI